MKCASRRCPALAGLGTQRCSALFAKRRRSERRVQPVACWSRSSRGVPTDLKMSEREPTPGSVGAASSPRSCAHGGRASAQGNLDDKLIRFAGYSPRAAGGGYAVPARYGNPLASLSGLWKFDFFQGLLDGLLNERARRNAVVFPPINRRLVDAETSGKSGLAFLKPSTGVCDVAASNHASI